MRFSSNVHTTSFIYCLDSSLARVFDTATATATFLFHRVKTNPVSGHTEERASPLLSEAASEEYLSCERISPLLSETFFCELGDILCQSASKKLLWIIRFHRLIAQGGLGSSILPTGSTMSSSPGAPRQLGLRSRLH